MEDTEPHSVRMRLREATRRSHERVDSLFSSFDLGSPGGYAAFLEAHFIAMDRLEQHIDYGKLPLSINSLPAIDYRPLLAADLAGLTGETPSRLAAPRTAITPDEMVGLIYVKAGSRMGAQILLRRVRDLNPDLPVRYLAERAGIGYWQCFIAALETDFSTQPDIHGLENGAEAGFGFFEDACEGCRIPA